MFENIRADWQAHGRSWEVQGFWVMLVYRFGRWRYQVRSVWLRKPLSLIYRIWSTFIQIITGIELPCEVEVGRNFIIDHYGGIVVSGYAKFGDNCRIRTGVVVGLSRTDEPCAPVFGNNVDIGAGAKVLGPIRIGNNVCIGANAVVICDVPDNSIAVGVPAVIKRNAVERRKHARGARGRKQELTRIHPLREVTVKSLRDTSSARSPSPMEAEA